VTSLEKVLNTVLDADTKDVALITGIMFVFIYFWYLNLKEPKTKIQFLFCFVNFAGIYSLVPTCVSVCKGILLILKFKK
jgi:hypothetical protein